MTGRGCLTLCILLISSSTSLAQEDTRPWPLDFRSRDMAGPTSTVTLTRPPDAPPDFDPGTVQVLAVNAQGVPYNPIHVRQKVSGMFPEQRYRESEDLLYLHSGVDISTDQHTDVRVFTVEAGELSESGTLGTNSEGFSVHNFKYVHINRDDSLERLWERYDNAGLDLVLPEGTLIGTTKSLTNRMRPHLHLEMYERQLMVNALPVLDRWSDADAPTFEDRANQPEWNQPALRVVQAFDSGEQTNPTPVAEVPDRVDDNDLPVLLVGGKVDVLARVLDLNSSNVTLSTPPDRTARGGEGVPIRLRPSLIEIDTTGPTVRKVLPLAMPGTDFTVPYRKRMDQDATATASFFPNIYFTRNTLGMPLDNSPGFHDCIITQDPYEGGEFNTDDYPTRNGKYRLSVLAEDWGANPRTPESIRTDTLGNTATASRDLIICNRPGPPRFRNVSKPRKPASPGDIIELTGHNFFNPDNRTEAPQVQMFYFQRETNTLTPAIGKQPTWIVGPTDNVTGTIRFTWPVVTTPKPAGARAMICVWIHCVVGGAPVAGHLAYLDQDSARFAAAYVERVETQTKQGTTSTWFVTLKHVDPDLGVGPPRRVYSPPAQPRCIALSGDGRRLVIGSREQPASLVVVDLESGGTRLVEETFTSPYGYLIGGHALSRDGTRLVYMKNDWIPGPNPYDFRGEHVVSIRLATIPIGSPEPISIRTLHSFRDHPTDMAGPSVTVGRFTGYMPAISPNGDFVALAASKFDTQTGNTSPEVLRVDLRSQSSEFIALADPGFGRWAYQAVYVADNGWLAGTVGGMVATPVLAAGPIRASLTVTDSVGSIVAGLSADGRRVLVSHGVTTACKHRLIDIDSSGTQAGWKEFGTGSTCRYSQGALSADGRFVAVHAIEANSEGLQDLVVHDSVDDRAIPIVSATYLLDSGNPLGFGDP